MTGLGHAKREVSLTEAEHKHAEMLGLPPLVCPDVQQRVSFCMYSQTVRHTAVSLGSLNRHQLPGITSGNNVPTMVNHERNMI